MSKKRVVISLENILRKTVLKRNWELNLQHLNRISNKFNVNSVAFAPFQRLNKNNREFKEKVTAI